MPTPPTTPPTGDPPRARFFSKTKLLLLIALLLLLAVCIAISWTTRGAMAFLHSQRGPRAGAPQSLVDLQPWQTASALAPLAVSSEENEYAREAERLADHEVDQAFAAALRQARLDAQHKSLTGDALALSQQIVQLQQLKRQDQAQVDSLTAQVNGKGAATNTIQTSSPSDDLEVAKAQLGLDADELADAQHDLARASGDHSGEIQDELAAHEASMQKYDSQVQNGETAVISAKQNHTLASRIAAWFSQRNRQSLLDQALEEARNEVRTLTAEHNALEAKANAAAAVGAAPDRAAELASLKDRSIRRQILSIDDDRIQTEQQLVTVYGKWSAQVKLQHQIVLHLILGSFGVILVILIGMVVSDTLVRHWLDRPAIDRRQMRTLRSVLELSIQVLGAVLILLVVFGTPKETPTILGLATAALTIALQDYILAFLGWFVLMGKNGIHVGDWVEINNVGGEVTEFGLLTTTLMETGQLAGQGYPTGRRISFMNGYAIRGQFFNFSTAGQWMWDEISVSVPASADVHRVMDEVQKVVVEETHENSRRAEQEWKRGAHDAGLARFSTEPAVYLRPSAAGTDLQIRYVTSAYDRFEVRNRLYQRVAEMLHEEAAAKQ